MANFPKTLLGNLWGSQQASQSLPLYQGGSGAQSLAAAKQNLMMQMAQAQAASLGGVNSSQLGKDSPKHFKRPFDKALYKAQKTNSRTLDKVDQYYRHVDADTLIELFGKLRPVFDGKPQDFAMNLLNAGAGPARWQTMFSYRLAGLVFMVPEVIGRRRRRVRLTAGGLKLLEHWATERKNFKPFFEAYISKKAKKDILSTCFDFEMNAEPDFIRQTNIRNAEELAKLHAKAIEQLRDHAAAIMQSQSQWWNQNFWSNTQTLTNQTITAPLTLTSTNGPQWTAIGTGTSIFPQPPVSSEADVLAQTLRPMTSMAVFVKSPQEVCLIDQAGTQHTIWKRT